MTEKSKDIAKNVVQKIKTGEIKMRPKAYFVLSALLVGIGLVGFTMLSGFFTNLALYKLRVHEPFAFLAFGRPGFTPFVKLFPWDKVLISLVSLVLGVCLLKKLDVSYKKSLAFLGITMLAIVLVTGITLDKSGFNERVKRTPMGRGMYHDTPWGEDWIVGRVVGINENSIWVEDNAGNQVEVVIYDNTFLPFGKSFNKGDCVRVVGTRSPNGQEIKAKAAGICGGLAKHPSVKGIMRRKMDPRSTLLPK